jgi:hypothetical protein
MCLENIRAKQAAWFPRSLLAAMKDPELTSNPQGSDEFMLGQILRSIAATVYTAEHIPP